METSLEQTFETTNRLGERFLMRKLSNGVIETVKYLGKVEVNPSMCSECNHSKVLHTSKRKGGCFALKELHGYSAIICGCKHHD